MSMVEMLDEFIMEWKIQMTFLIGVKIMCTLDWNQKECRIELNQSIIKRGGWLVVRYNVDVEM